MHRRGVVQSSGSSDCDKPALCTCPRSHRYHLDGASAASALYQVSLLQLLPQRCQGFNHAVARICNRKYRHEVGDSSRTWLISHVLLREGRWRACSPQAAATEPRAECRAEQRASILKLHPPPIPAQRRAAAVSDSRHGCGPRRGRATSASVSRSRGHLDGVPLEVVELAHVRHALTVRPSQPPNLPEAVVARASCVSGPGGQARQVVDMSRPDRALCRHVIQGR
jgi:hypothetical protein